MVNIIESANQIVTEYVEREFIRSTQKLDKERHGEGCGCRSCQQFAVREVNSWLNIVDPEAMYPRYEVVFSDNGKATIEEMG